MTDTCEEERTNALEATHPRASAPGSPLDLYERLSVRSQWTRGPKRFDAEHLFASTGEPGAEARGCVASRVSDKLSCSPVHQRAAERSADFHKTSRRDAFASRRLVVARDHRPRAERVGFEPTVPLRAHRFSRPARSTTPASLQIEFSAAGGRRRAAKCSGRAGRHQHRPRSPAPRPADRVACGGPVAFWCDNPDAAG